ncbi:hypothetical protein IJD34_03020 [bacterium]|nr:hypothetical protein [bacterium]
MAKKIQNFDLKKNLYELSHQISRVKRFSKILANLVEDRVGDINDSDVAILAEDLRYKAIKLSKRMQNIEEKLKM